VSFLTDDLDALAADTGFTVPVVCGASSTRGWFDWTDTSSPDSSGFDVFIRQRSVLIRTGTLTGLANGVTVTVDGTSYVVHDLNHEGDGKTLRVVLA
jgi:hypothetical protein